MVFNVSYHYHIHVDLHNYVKCIWSLHHGKSTIKFHKYLTNCFQRIVNFIAIVTIKAMCIQFTGHFSRGRHPNFQQLHACSWEHWVNIVDSFLKKNISKTLLVHWRCLFSILVSDWHAFFAKTYEGTVTSKMLLV